MASSVDFEAIAPQSARINDATCPSADRSGSRPGHTSVLPATAICKQRKPIPNALGSNGRHGLNSTATTARRAISLKTRQPAATFSANTSDALTTNCATALRTNAISPAHPPTPTARPPNSPSAMPLATTGIEFNAGSIALADTPTWCSITIPMRRSDAPSTAATASHARARTQ